MVIISPTRIVAKVLDTEEILVRIVAEMFTYNVCLFIAFSVLTNKLLLDPTPKQIINASSTTLGNKRHNSRSRKVFEMAKEQIFSGRPCFAIR